MEELLIPYGLKDGNIVHINEVERGLACNCICPACNGSLIARKGGIKCHHFGHNPGLNCNSETALHATGKRMIFQQIEYSLERKEEIPIEWKCSICEEMHTGNLLKKTDSASIEYSYKGGRADIGLLDVNKIPVVFIEVVVTHAPENNVYDIAKKRGIQVIEIKLKNGTDLENLRHVPLKANKEMPLCRNKRRIRFYKKRCWSCGKITPVSFGMIGNKLITPDDFTAKERIWVEYNGIKLGYFKTPHRLSIRNKCMHCGKPVLVSKSDINTKATNDTK